MDFLGNTQNLKNLPQGFDKSADLLSTCLNHEEDFFPIMCASQKVRTLSRKTFEIQGQRPRILRSLEQFIQTVKGQNKII